MFYKEDTERLSSAFCHMHELTQLEGCVVDLLAARASVADELEHLENAQNNLAQFIGPGEDRWAIVGDLAHHMSNVDGTINITTYFRKEKPCH